MTNPAAIARGLSKAQRKAALTDDALFAFDHKGKWQALSSPTAKILYRLGLIEKCDTLARPTPLGLAVRAILNAAGGGSGQVGARDE